MSSTRPSAVPAAAYHPTTEAAGPIVVAATLENGKRALQVTRELAARTGRSAIVVSAVEPPMPALVGVDGAPAWTPDINDVVAIHRDSVARHVREALGEDVAWPLEIIVDSPPRAVADAARAHRASLLVIGLGRHDLAVRLLGGEVALRTVRRAQTPVLAVTDAPFPVPPKVAVAAMDFSPSSVEAAHTALDLLADGGTLHLVHVWSRESSPAPAARAAEEHYERSLPSRFAGVERVLLDRARNVTILPATLVGSPAERIVDFARSHGADLVAAGKQGHGLFERLLVGRVTTALVRAAPCAVLVTPELPPTERATIELALSGATASSRREDWSALLDAFTRRNRGRRASVEVDESDFGAQAQETGYTFLGATYDRHDGRVAIMLGAPADVQGGAPHLTRTIGNATGISVRCDAAGRDVALTVNRGDGRTTLTFFPDEGAG